MRKEATKFSSVEDSSRSFGRRSRRAWAISLTSGAILMTLSASPCLAQSRASNAEEVLEEAEMSLETISRHLTIPIGPLWNVTFDNSLTSQDGGGVDDELAYAGSIEPYLPLRLSRLGLKDVAWAQDLWLNTQLVFPVFETTPLPGGRGNDSRSGIGDIQLSSLLSSSPTSGLLFGVGPTFIFPSASDNALGQGKYQIGPSVILGFQDGGWTAYADLQQWWSIAGDDDRESTRQLSFQYVLLRDFPRHWIFGMQPTIEVDWTQSSDNRLLFPVGLGVGKTIRIGRLPVQLWMEFDYYAVRPDDLSSPRWGLDIQIIPTLGKLF